MSFVRSLSRPMARPMARSITGSSGGGGGGGGGTLLLDDLSGVLAYSPARKLRTTYSGSAIRVRRSFDDSEQDFGFDGSGNLDESALTTFCGAGNGFVVTLYDQQGSNNATQSTAAAQPLIVSSGTVIKQGGVPAMRFESGDFLSHAYGSSSGIDADHAGVVMAKPEATLAGFDGLMSTNGGTAGFSMFGNLSAANEWGALGSGSTEKASGATLSSGTAYVLAMDRAASGTGNFRTSGAASGTYTGPLIGQGNGNIGGGNGTQSFVGLIGEAILSSAAADRSTIESSVATLYGITLA